ncbi:hypothetical protein BTL55_14775 [Bordetella trematum]|nr:hypothetical protein BTL55_14775 [Bordetella trematum]
MDGVVLSGVPGIVLSGVGLSCYQACRSAANPRQHCVFWPSNFPNLISLTFSRETLLRWTTTTRPQTQQQKPGFPTWRARP